MRSAAHRSKKKSKGNALLTATIVCHPPNSNQQQAWTKGGEREGGGAAVPRYTKITSNYYGKGNHTAVSSVRAAAPPGARAPSRAPMHCTALVVTSAPYSSVNRFLVVFSVSNPNQAHS